MSTQSVPSRSIEFHIKEELGEEALQEYWDNVRENNYNGLIQLWRKLDLLDPEQVYGLDWTTHKQESLFDKGASKYGGGFIQDLLKLYRSADPGNRTKIRRTWPEYWIKYVGMGLMVRRRNRSEE